MSWGGFDWKKKKKEKRKKSEQGTNKIEITPYFDIVPELMGNHCADDLHACTVPGIVRIAGS